MEEVYELLAKGGWLMIPILLCSVIVLGVLLERLWSLRRDRVVPDGLLARIRELAGKGKLTEAVSVCEGNESSLAAVLAAGLQRFDKGREAMSEALQDAGRQEAAHLERFVAVVGTIAAIAPLLGLLGTVTGMIKIFQRVTTEGVGDPRMLAGGIWEALITTAAGLTVAIPAYVAYRYLLARADGLVLEMEQSATTVIKLAEEAQEERG